MVKKRKYKKTTIKKIYVLPKEDPYKKDNEYNEKLKSEMKELELKKSTIPKGFSGTLKKLSINKQINDRKKILQTQQRTIHADRLTGQIQKQIALEKARGELLDIRKKNQVSFEGLGGFSSGPKKELKYNDLF